MNIQGGQVLDTIILFMGIVILVLFIYSSIISVSEREKKASIKFFIFGIIISITYFIVGFYGVDYYNIVRMILLFIPILVLLIYFLPFRFHRQFQKSIPNGQIDERNIMFSRNELKEGTDKYNNYYLKNPELEEIDNRWRTNPGLLSPKASNYNAAAFMASRASFFTVAGLKSKIDGDVSEDKIVFKVDEVTNFLKNWSKKLGAFDIGITELRDYHTYSYRGRKEAYNDKVELKHKYAIALTVEMDIDMVNSGPLAPIVMESAQKYMDSGAIAVQIAAFIRNLGYPALAHIDGNYQVICPLVARDAGLGDIGRMGLLMTPKLGPRVRIAVVTTDLPLLVDETGHDPSMLEFCTNCKKCAINCPSNSISFVDREDINGVKRWQINQETCFDLWTKTGTDCGRCMSVCPYSHPNNTLHNIVRFGIKNSSIFSKVALLLDDVIYGKNPAVKPPLKWMDIEPNN